MDPRESVGNHICQAHFTQLPYTCLRRDFLNIAEGVADVSALFVVNNDTVTRGHNLKLFVQQSRIDVRKYFFSNRVIQCWNSLPATPNDFASLGCFRRMLQRTDLGKFKVGRT